MKNIDLSPVEINLDLENPRFSLFDFKNEKDVIIHLIKYENLYELIDSFLKEGYNTLGERIIVLDENNNYTVLEGNRRIAALKCIFEYTDLLRSTYREKVKVLELEKFNVASDVITNRKDAEYKIAAKHIASIKSWRSIDKYVYYYNMYQRLKNTNTTKESLAFIQETSPEPVSEIRRSIKYYNFLSRIHDVVKKTHKNLLPLSLLSNDVLTSRVYNALKKELGLREENWIDIVIPKEKVDLFNKMLFSLGVATWGPESGTGKGALNTRTFSKQEDWESILIEDKVLPGFLSLVETNYYKSSDN